MRSGPLSHPARRMAGAALLAALAWPPSGLQAQMTDRYITQASFQVSADQRADLWLNGHWLFTQDYTPLQGGPQTHLARPDHLCYFQRDNTLAIRVKSPGHPGIGVAYLLRLVLSDGSHQIFTSSETDQHLALYLTDGLEPYGWQQPGFDDHAWGKAYDPGHVPYAALLPDPDGEVVGFLSADGDNRVHQPGEEHLFRIRFHLDVLPNPRCAPAEPRRSPTPIPFPAEDLPSPVPTPTWKAPALPTVPERRPRSVQVVDSWEAPETLEVHLAPTPPPSPTPPPPPSPTPTPGDLQPALSFYVSLMDGPGVDQLDVVDAAGTPLRTLLKEDLTGSGQVWVRWDGRDARGVALPRGNY
ncbi:MAG TPA: hypothetical protein VFR02_08405, partial [bacterium]|nr:hypothetical protein [bacterium]